jgi:hypothetical protein
MPGLHDELAAWWPLLSPPSYSARRPRTCCRRCSALWDPDPDDDTFLTPFWFLLRERHGLSALGARPASLRALFTRPVVELVAGSGFPRHVTNRSVEARYLRLHRGAMTQPDPDDDPRPQPPPRPDDGACCGQGCNPCVFDLYEIELERYEALLRAWEARRHASLRPLRSGYFITRWGSQSEKAGT